MEVIKLREKIDKAWLGAALMLSILPALGLMTGTAFSMGIYGMNYQETALFEDPERYWYIIKLELMIVSYMLIMSKIEFPLLKHCYKSMLRFKQQHKAIAYFTLYLIIPIIAVTFCLVLLYIFDL